MSKKLKIISSGELKLSQMLLPGINETDKSNYSSTAELYDIIPKYSYGKQRGDDNLPAIERHFKHRGRSLSLTLTPATIKDEQGSYKSLYPAAREEIIEDVLRKLSIHKNGHISKANEDDYEISLKTTIGEISAELAAHGHTFNWREIKEAIRVCNSARISIKSEEGNEVAISSTIFPVIAYEDTDKVDVTTKIIVRFHPLVTKSVLAGSMRVINYKQFMKYKKGISKWLHKRISHIFAQANSQTPYVIKLSTILRDGGFPEHVRISGNKREVCMALDEMKKVGSLEKYSYENVYSEERKNKIANVLFTIWLSDQFIKDVRKANFVQKQEIEDNKDQKELIVFGEELKVEMSKRVYGLNKTFIESYINRIKDKDSLHQSLLALKAAEEAINRYKEQGSKVVNGALTRKSLKENWIPTEMEQAEVENNVIEDKQGFAYHKNDSSKFELLVKNLRARIGSNTFNAWFSNMNLISIEPKLIFEVESAFFKDWIENNYYAQFSLSVKEVFRQEDYNITLTKK